MRGTLVVAVVVFLCAACDCTRAQLFTPCLDAPANYSTLRTAAWNGTVVGFCEGLFSPADELYPLQDITCEGEGGNMTYARRAMGLLKPACRTALAKFMCLVNFPKWRPPFGLAVPCTSEQANATHPNPTTLLAWLERECGNEERGADILASSREQLLGFDDQLENSAMLRGWCRVVDGGANEREEDRIDPGWIPTVWSCPPYFVKVDDDDQRDPGMVGCSVPCPNPYIMSDGEWEFVVSMFGWQALIPLALSLACMAKWVWKHPLRLPASATFHLLIAVVVLLVAGLVAMMEHNFKGQRGTFSVFCENDYTLARQDHFPCAVQGLFGLYASKLACLWCFVLTYHVYSVATSTKLTLVTSLRHELYLLGACYGWPLVTIGIAFALDKVGYVASSPWCIVTGERRGLYQYLLFYSDVCVFLGLSFYYGFASARLVWSRGDGELSPAMRVFLNKLLLVAFSALLLDSTILVVRVHASIAEDSIAKSLTTWLACEAEMFVAGLESNCSKPVFTFHGVPAMLVSMYITVGVVCVYVVVDPRRPEQREESKPRETESERQRQQHLNANAFWVGSWSHSGTPSELDRQRSRKRDQHSGLL